MFNWKKLCSNKRGFDSLHRELKAGRGVYILDSVKLPEDTCGGKVCTVTFKYYSDTRIELFCSDAPIAYRGSDPDIRWWLTYSKKEFESFAELKKFLYSFSQDSLAQGSEVQSNAPVPAEESVTPPPRPRVEFDRDAITVPQHSNYTVIDKDKLILDLKNEIFGQDDNILKIAHLVCNHLATKHRSRPLSVFLYGSTGIGKSAVVAKLVEAVNSQLGADKAFAYRPVDCTQFQERADISRLTGAAPGYVGFEEPGVFAILEDNPNTVFVFEEIEKAASNVTEVIMQAMETGRQETNGKTLKNGNNYYDLSNCVIFFTSNVEVKEKNKLGFACDSPAPTPVPEESTEPKTMSGADIARMIMQETNAAKTRLAETGKFRREVVGRMNAIIKFDQIGGEAVKDIAVNCISNIAAKDHYLYITEIGSQVLQEFIDAAAPDVAYFGVRVMRNAAQCYFSDALRAASHVRGDYARVKLSGSLDNIIVTDA